MENKTKITFALRLAPNALADIGEVARRQHIPLKTMIRAWTLQRLDQEKEEIIQTIKGSELS